MDSNVSVALPTIPAVATATGTLTLQPATTRGAGLATDVAVACDDPKMLLVRSTDTYASAPASACGASTWVVLTVWTLGSYASAAAVTSPIPNTDPDSTLGSYASAVLCAPS